MCKFSVNIKMNYWKQGSAIDKRFHLFRASEFIFMVPMKEIETADTNLESLELA